VKITAITAQQRDPNRVNVMVDGKYRFSLSIFQVADLGVKVGREYSEAELSGLEGESQFGKLYARALEYCLMRPHSDKEVRDYLYRKTLSRRVRNRKTGEIKQREGYDTSITEKVHGRLVDKGYIDDEKFTRFWVENRNVRKGASKRKLQAELAVKGIDRGIVDQVLAESGRSDTEELRKVVERKAGKYNDPQKLIAYLARQGFSYDDIKSVLDT
jgi:regulatory protein